MDAMQAHIISLFNIEEFRRKIRSTYTIKNTVTEVLNTYKVVINNTIKEVIGINSEDYEIECLLADDNETKLSLRHVIGYFLYLLQAMRMIELPSQGKKVTIKADFQTLYQQYNNCLLKSSKKDLSFREGNYDE